MESHEPVIHLLCEDALLISFQPGAFSMSVQRRLLKLAAGLREQEEAHLVEIVPGPGSLMLRLAPECRFGPLELTRQLEQRWDQLADEPEETPRHLSIPVQYGGDAGPDLADVARHAGLTADQLISIHAGAEYEVMCLGFQPGFPYLEGLDPRLAVPRLATPRPLIPAGSVAIGGNRTGIYPSATPGGWHIIGRTRLALFDPHADSPTLLLPGDRLRFVMETGSHA